MPQQPAAGATTLLCVTPVRRSQPSERPRYVRTDSYVAVQVGKAVNRRMCRLAAAYSLRYVDGMRRYGSNRWWDVLPNERRDVCRKAMARLLTDGDANLPNRNPKHLLQTAFVD